MKTMHERFDEWFDLKESSSNPEYPITTGELKDFIEQELKKEREEIVEIIKELAEPYDGAKWLNQVNPETIINTIKNRV